MAKINVIFNDTNYSFDETVVSPIIDDFKEYLTSSMSGTGAVIKLDDFSYNVDATKLSNATNAFISYLGTVAGNGLKVVVNGVEYGVDSSKMSATIAALETVFGNLSGGSGGGSWKGTPAIGTWDGVSDPTPDQYVENIYVNTALSVEEVVEILSKLSFTNVEGMEQIVVLQYMGKKSYYNPRVAMGILRMNNSYMIIAGSDVGGSMPLFASDDSLGVGFVGWNPDSENEITGSEVAVLVAPNVVVDSGGVTMTIDNQQELYSSLISLTPFEKVEDVVFEDNEAGGQTAIINSDITTEDNNAGGKTINIK